MRHRQTCQCARCYYTNRLFWIVMGIVTLALLLLGIWNSNHAW